MARLVDVSSAKWEKTRVQCYAGYKGEEEPRSFDDGSKRLNILEIVDRWRTPKQAFFKVKVGGSKFFLLRQDSVSHEWEVTPFGPRR